MTQQSRAQAALPEETGLTPRTSMEAHNYLQLQSQGSDNPLLGPGCTQSTNMQAGKTLYSQKTEKTKRKKRKEKERSLLQRKRKQNNV